MGLVISVTNMKGGVGKTTLTANLGHCLSVNYGKKVLLIDADPQFNLTQYCMDENEYEEILSDIHKGTIFDIFIPSHAEPPTALTGKKKKGRSKKMAYVYEIRKKLFLIPSSINLIDFIDQRKSGAERLLSKYIESIKDEFDFILIDCPPTSTILSRAAYLSSDAYVIPMGMDYFSVMGIPLLQKDINDFMETYGREMKGIGIIKTKYLKWTKVAKKHKDIVKQFAKELGLKIFSVAFTQRQGIQNALSERRFILEHCLGGSREVEDIEGIAEEFLESANQIEED